MARIASFLLFIVTVSLLRPATARPLSLELDISAREVHEDNLNLLSGAGRPLGQETGVKLPTASRTTGTGGAVLAPDTRAGDFSTVAAAVLGASTIAGPGMELSLLSEFEQFRFHRFTGLDAATAGLRTRLVDQFTDIHSFTAGLSCGRAWYDADAFTGNRWGGTFELQQQTAAKFWVAEGIQYERHRARDAGLGYTGRAASIRTGYRFRDRTSVVLAYRHLLRGLDDGSRIEARSLTLSGAWDALRHMQVLASFEHQRLARDPLEDRTGNNILTAGIAYFY